MDSETLTKLNRYIEQSENIVFFGGAGVSTESGVPDFRSENGLYNQHDTEFSEHPTEYYLSKSCLRDDPASFYKFYRQKMDVTGIQPNDAHKYLAELEKRGKLKAVITQNVDGLHQVAGSKTVYEIHGTMSRNYCSKCAKQYPSDYIFRNEDPVPTCECGGYIRPAVTLYGESLPGKEFAHAANAIESADMLIVGGTSLQVFPAAGLLSYFHGNHLIIVNRDGANIPLGEHDLVITDPIGEVFRELAALQNITL